MADGTEGWRWATFDALGGREVHDLLKLRMDVFVVEQACAFAEIDGKDFGALHLLHTVDGALAGCLRVFAPPAPGDSARIGRVATSAAFRGTGLGNRLMGEGVRYCRESYPGHPIDLSAQAHLMRFYERHGFTCVSDAYLEDDIPHVDMRRLADTA